MLDELARSTGRRRQSASQGFAIARTENQECDRLGLLAVAVG
jgi:hypothetical protein